MRKLEVGIDSNNDEARISSWHQDPMMIEGDDSIVTANWKVVTRRATDALDGMSATHEIEIVLPPGLFALFETEFRVERAHGLGSPEVVSAWTTFERGATIQKSVMTLRHEIGHESIWFASYLIVRYWDEDASKVAVFRREYQLKDDA